MCSIRIIAVPPGFAPLAIREQWVGVSISLATDDDLRQHPLTGQSIGNQNRGGHLVLRSKAIEALLVAGKREAAAYWQALPRDALYLRFRQEVCALVA